MEFKLKAEEIEEESAPTPSIESSAVEILIVSRIQRKVNVKGMFGWNVYNQKKASQMLIVFLRVLFYLNEVANALSINLSSIFLRMDKGAHV